MKEEEGARTIACPHKVGSLFMFMKLNRWCSTVRSLKAGFQYQWSRSRNQKRRAYDLVKTAFRFRL